MCKELTVLGSINVDHTISVPYFAKPGETLVGNNYHITYGGKGANQAIAATRLGAKVNFIGCIGNDEIGLTMKKSFEKEGININAIKQIENTNTGLAMIQVTPSGENSIVISHGANNYVNENTVKTHQQTIIQSDYLLMQLEIPLNTITYAAKIAKNNHTQVILNPAPAQPLPDELLQNIDIITPNETEAEIITGVQINDEQSAAQSAKIFHQKGIKTVLITLGEKGVYYSTHNQGKFIKGFRVQAKDTTAAGDTFNGAFVTALMENKSTDEAITFAQAAAAISVTKQGAQPSIPTKEDTDRFLSNQI